MSDIRKVWPKEPLMAHRVELMVTPPTWMVEFYDDEWTGHQFYSDAEFSRAFLDAAVLTELIDAARALDDSDPMTVIHQNARAALHKALAAFDAVMLPDTEK